MRSPFSLFLRVKPTTGEKFWYAKFWNEDSNRYDRTRALGVPYSGRRGGRDLATKAAQAIVTEISREADPLLIDYISNFWAPDSRHVRTRALVDHRPLSLDYLDHNRRAIRLHIAPYPGFKSLRLSRVRAGIIKDWQLWAIERGATPRAANIALQAIKVPIRDAVARGDLPADPLTVVKKVPEEPRERGVLTNDEIVSLIHANEKDPRIRASILLAVLAGLRRGEIRGLRWGDIGWDQHLLNIRHNAVDMELDKLPKTGSKRVLPLHQAIADALKEVQATAPSIGNDDFVFFSTIRSHSPITGRTLLIGLCRMLAEIGIDEAERKRRNLNLHAMRHSFITLARRTDISDIDVMALSGHKSPEMLTRYSHAAQTIDFQATRLKLEGAVNE